MKSIRPRLHFFNSYYAACLIATLVIFSHGCGPKEWKAKTFPAKGQLTINGEAPVHAMVELVPIGTAPDVRNSRAWGVVKEDGTFELSTYKLGDGVPPGEYAVIITWPWDLAAAVPADRLRGAYSDPKNSAWKVTIANNENVLAPIAIDGAKIPKQVERAAGELE